MKIASYGLTDVGRKREQNEDSILINEDLGLFVVADGMGGHLGGEYASHLAVTTIEEILRNFQEDPDATLPPGHEFDCHDLSEQIRYAIRMASYRIFEESTKNQKLTGMGTTAVVLMMQGEKAYFANVGDSRAYLLREGKILQLTMDHSLVSEQLRAGFITSEQVKNHKFKNVITRSVGFQEDVEIDLLIREVDGNDRFLLCTDGLTNMLSDSEICKIVSKKPLDQACQKLIEGANKKGGDDNVSAILVEILEGQKKGEGGEETEEVTEAVSRKKI